MCCRFRAEERTKTSAGGTDRSRGREGRLAPAQQSTTTEQSIRADPSPRTLDTGSKPVDTLSERQARVLRSADLLSRKPGTRPGTRAETAGRRIVVEELMKAGLSVRTISIATNIPPTSVHRATRAVARAEARQEMTVLKVMEVFLEKAQQRKSKGRSRSLSARAL